MKENPIQHRNKGEDNDYKYVAKNPQGNGNPYCKENLQDDTYNDPGYSLSCFERFYGIQVWRQMRRVNHFKLVNYRSQVVLEFDSIIKPYGYEREKCN
jgi:hypothetical protein